MKLLKHGLFFSLLVLLCLPVSAPHSAFGKGAFLKEGKASVDVNALFALPDSSYNDLWSDADITDDDDTVETIAKQISFAGTVLFLFFLIQATNSSVLRRTKRLAFSFKLLDAPSYLQVFRI